MSFVLRMKLQSEIEDKIFKCWRKLWGLPQLQAAQNLWLWPSQSSAGLWVSISGHILVCWVLDSQLSTEAAHLSPHQPNIILQNIVWQTYKQSLFVLEQNKREYCQMIQSKYGQLGMNHPLLLFVHVRREQCLLVFLDVAYFIQMSVFPNKCT